MRYFKKTFVVFSATALNFLFSYLLHFVLGRLLGPSEYGQFGVVLNLIWITGIPSTAIVASLVKYSAEFKAKREFGKLKSLLTTFIKVSFSLNLLYMIFYIVLSFPLSEVLGGGISSLIMIVAVSFPIGGVTTILINFLQGVGRVYHYSFITSSSTLIKLLFAVLLIFLGFGVFGALLSLIFTSLCVLVLCLPLIWSFLRHESKKINRLKILKFALPVLFTNFFVGLVLYFDLFFVSSFLGSEQAGFYEAAVTLSRAFLMSMSVLAVFFPEFSKQGALNNFKKLRSNIKWALFYTGVICFIILAAYWFFPEFIINLTYSSSYLEAVPILRVLSVGYAFYALFTVLLYALWSLGKHKVAGIFGIFLFTADIILLSILVPIYGVLGAAFVTTSLLIVLFLFSLVLVFSKFLKK